MFSLLRDRYPRQIAPSLVCDVKQGVCYSPELLSFDCQEFEVNLTDTVVKLRIEYAGAVDMEPLHSYRNGLNPVIPLEQLQVLDAVLRFKPSLVYFYCSTQTELIDIVCTRLGTPSLVARMWFH